MFSQRLSVRPTVRRQRFSATDMLVVFASLKLELYSTDGQTHG